MQICAEIVSLCDAIAALRAAGAETSTPIMKVSELIDEITPVPETVAALVVANLPVLLKRHLADADPSVNCIPHVGNGAARRIPSAIIKSGEVEAALVLLQNGGRLNIFPGDRLPEKIIEQDCPRRLNLFLALAEDIFAFDTQLLKIVDAAGPRVAPRLLELDDPAVMNPSLSVVIMAQELAGITLKQAAIFLSGQRHMSDFRMHGDIEDRLSAPARRLLELKKSNHGQMELSRLEPDRLAMVLRPEGESFYGLRSLTGAFIHAQ